MVAGRDTSFAASLRALRALLAETWPLACGLALVQALGYAAIPFSLWVMGSDVSWIAPAVAATALTIAALPLHQRLRKRARGVAVLQSARAALGGKRVVPEAEIDSAFWRAYIAETAVSSSVPGALASAVGVVAALGFATARLGAAVVVPTAGILVVGAAARLALQRAVAARLRRFVDARRVAAQWLVAAMRGSGELAAPRSRVPLLARINEATARWSEAQDAHDRASTLIRILITVAVLGALALWVAHLGALDLARGFVVEGAVSGRVVSGVALFAVALPAARRFAGHLDALVAQLEELRELERAGGDAVSSEGVVLAQAPRSLRVRDLVVRYGAEIALQIDTLDVELAGPIGIAGPNGAGKSTFASVIANARMADGGSLMLDGVAVGTIGRDAFAFVPQDPVIVESLTVLENTRLVVPDVARAAVGDALAALGLACPLDTPAGQLSLGERRRVALARALLTDAKVLVLDEPDAWLDDAVRGTLIAMLRERSARAAVFVVSHRTDVLASMDQVVRLVASHRLEAHSHDGVAAVAAAASR